ncbi:MAG TPA: copper resistance CopC family protein [Methylocella sp.]|nr:copper resistance CopC family protein [Methylocella sp.]
MQKLLKPFIVALLASSLAATAAFAHAFLDHAMPGVGGTVSGPVHELRLWYTQGVVTAFSAVTVTGPAGAIPASKPVNNPSNQQEVIVHLGRPLGPGTYTVNWRALSVDTHTTTGSFRFTVS